MKIYLDFDGTVVEHIYPEIGRCNFGSLEVVRRLQDAGHQIFLNTYRADCNNGTLEQAIKYLKDYAWMVTHPSNEDFELLPFEVLNEKIHPPIFDIDEFIKNGEIFIDDMSTGTPLKPAQMSNGFMVDWVEIERIFIEKGILPNNE